jgi:hypothetical protein
MQEDRLQQGESRSSAEKRDYASGILDGRLAALSTPLEEKGIDGMA